MFWNILRPRYWILDRQVRAANKTVIIVFLLLLGFGGQWVYDNLILRSMTILGSEQAIATVASALPVWLTFFLVFAMLGVGDMLYQLYLVPDLELLMVTPIPYRTIYLVKLLQCSRATWVPALMFGAFLMTLGAAQDAAASFYGLIALLLLAVVTLTTATVMILVIMLARVIPAQMVRTWMPLIMILVTFALVLSLPLITTSLTQEKTITFLIEALLNPIKLGLLTAGFLGGALAMSLFGYFIFDTSFHEGWDRYRVAPSGRVTRLSGVSRRWDLSWLVKWLPAPLRHFLVKEWLESRRNPRGPITMMQPVIIIVMLLLPFISTPTMIEYFAPFIFWFLSITLIMLVGTLPLSTSLMTLLEEGRKLALLRSAPISMSDVLKGKFWASWLPMVLSWMLILSIAGILLHFSVWQIVFLVGLMLWGLAGSTLATMTIGGLKADFSIEELKQRLPSPVSLLIIGLNTVFMLLTFLIFAWFLVRLVPSSQAVVMVQAFTGYGAIGWLFSDLRWIPLVLAGGQAVFWVGLRYLWNAAVRRLEGWEEGC